MLLETGKPSSNNPFAALMGGAQVRHGGARLRNAPSSVAASAMRDADSPHSHALVATSPLHPLLFCPQVEKDEYGRPKAYRHAALGGVFTRVTEGVSVCAVLCTAD
jgi:hypothetical protein